MENLTIGDGKDWTFMHGDWIDGPDGELIPPDGFDLEYLAVRSDQSYADFTARYRFKFRYFCGGAARLLFRLQDSRRFYALDIPLAGQQARVRYFWAGIVVGDGTPLQRYLSFRLIPGLCAKYDSWYEARLEAKGPRIRAWIDDVLVADVEDHTYASGRLGLGSITSLGTQSSRFANLSVEGPEVEFAEWPGLVPPKQHWISPVPTGDPECVQSYASLIQGKSPSTLLMHLTFGAPGQSENRRGVFVRTNDGGRTWSEPEPPTLELGFGGTYVKNDGTWVCVYPNVAPTSFPLPWKYFTYESPDEGRRWIGPRELAIGGELPVGWSQPGIAGIYRMHDGTLLMFFDAFREKPPGVGDEFLTIATTFVLRSDDDGATWSEPVRCDSYPADPGGPIPEGGFMSACAGNGGETHWAEVRKNVVMGIARVHKDPYMWKYQSNDGGRTWDPAAIGPFPGSCNSLTATENGAVVATTRFPCFAGHLSRDHGRTWELPVIIDYPLWANQNAMLVEPDVVGVSYMGICDRNNPGQADSRFARLKVTDDGLVLDH